MPAQWLKCACLMLLVASMLGLLGACKGKPNQSRLRIAVASSVQHAMEELIVSYTKLNPEVEIAATYGSSGSFFAQISNGAPFDLYFSADTSYPARLVEAGFADKDSLEVYASGGLVVWAPTGSTVDVAGRGIQALLDEPRGKIAIANPEVAPYGKAAIEALTHFKMLDAVEARLVRGENVSQTMQFAESGAASVALVPMSLAIAAGAERGRMKPLTVDSYSPIGHATVIPSGSSMKRQARAFQQFVLSNAGRSVLKKHGLLPQEDE